MSIFSQAGEVLIQPPPQRLAAADVFPFWITLLIRNAVDAKGAFTLWDDQHMEVLL